MAKKINDIIEKLKKFGQEHFKTGRTSKGFKYRFFDAREVNRLGVALIIDTRKSVHEQLNALADSLVLDLNAQPDAE